MFRQAKTDVIIRSDDNLFSLIDVFSGKHDPNYARTLEFAELSAQVYGDEIRPVLDWTPTNTQLKINEKADDGDKKSKGLQVFTWYKELDDKISVGIAFRGTRFTKIIDWVANLNWLTKFIPLKNNHYSQVQDLIESHIDALKRELEVHEKPIEFVTTGHSLGGGLAQKAAYQADDIKLSYVFDSSPVTGYFSVSKAKRKTSCKDLKIYRFYEKGEILAYLRAFTQLTYHFNFKPNKDPFIAEIKLNLLDGDPIDQHNIHTFIRKLAELIE